MRQENVLESKEKKIRRAYDNILVWSLLLSIRNLMM